MSALVTLNLVIIAGNVMVSRGRDGQLWSVQRDGHHGGVHAQQAAQHDHQQASSPALTQRSFNSVTNFGSLAGT